MDKAKILSSLKSLFLQELRDLYSAEKQLVEVLPAMKRSASDDDLREAFGKHLEETKEHMKRLQTIFRQLKEEPEGESCEAMEGLVKEASRVMDEEGEPHVKDAALIAEAQRIEHYEIAGYGTVRTYAEELDLGEAADELGKTLSEEKAADKKLNKLAAGGFIASGINREAEEFSAE